MMMAAATASVALTMIGPDDVGQDVAPDDAAARRPRGPGRLDELLLAQRQHLRRAPRAPCTSRTPRPTRAMMTHGVPPNFLMAMARMTSCGTIRNRSVNRIRNWSCHLPKNPAIGAGGGAEDRRQEADGQADGQRDLPGVEDLGQLVAAEVVGAHEVLRRRRLVDASSRFWSFLGYGAIQRGAEAQHDQQDEHDQRQDGHPVVEEAAAEELPLRAGHGLDALLHAQLGQRRACVVGPWSVRSGQGVALVAAAHLVDALALGVGAARGRSESRLMPSLTLGSSTP